MDPLDRPRPLRRAAATPSASAKRAILRMDLRHGDPERIAEAVRWLLGESGLSSEERVQVLGGVLVVEALRPYWTGDRTAEQAHLALRTADPELADAIEALAPMLLGHAEVREEAGAAIEAIEAMLRAG
ncbi:MAG: hypothetical protein C4558_06255 [Dehalococcoidia bacterium]|nr:MAG: hypothetical protein C4558_06255 [Dehalococcoidia bacterium]